MSAPAAEREIAEIKAGLAASTSRREKARRNKDADAMASAIVEIMRWRRKAGLLLLAGAATHETFKVGTTTAEHWRMLGSLDDIEDKIKASVARAVAAMRVEHTGTTATAGIKMRVSDWFVDELGIRSRTVTAIDDEPTIAATQS